MRRIHFLPYCHSQDSHRQVYRELIRLKALSRSRLVDNKKRLAVQSREIRIQDHFRQNTALEWRWL